MVAPQTVTVQEAQNILPQELVNLIVDQILALEPPAASRAALRTCAQISRSFAAQSRPYIWKNYEFRLGQGYQRRAYDLLQLAKCHRDSKALLSSVSSVKFIYDVPTPEDWVPVELPPGRLEPIKNIFKERRNYVHEFLNTKNCPSLQDVTVETRGPAETFLDWGQIKYSIEPAVTAILSSKNLKTVTLHNLKNVSMDLILSVCFDSAAVEELNIRDVTFAGDPFLSPLNIIPTRPSNLRRMELKPSLLVDGQIRSFFSFLPLCYLQLIALAVSIPYWTRDLDNLWGFMTSPTLETLELDYHIRGSAVAPVHPLSRCNLTSLRNLKFTTFAPDDSSAIESSQDVLLNLLTPPTDLHNLRSLELRYCLSAVGYKPHYHTEDISLKPWKAASHWPVIDNRIADEYFPVLESLTISVEVRYQTDTCSSEYTLYIPEDELKCTAEVMFPRLTATTKINVDIEGKVMFLPSQGSPSCSVYFEDN